MTKDDIIRMAREAGASFETAESMFRFAALVAAAEREACAQTCEALRSNWNYCADAIRARGDDFFHKKLA